MLVSNKYLYAHGERLRRFTGVRGLSRARRDADWQLRFWRSGGASCKVWWNALSTPTESLPNICSKISSGKSRQERVLGVLLDTFCSRSPGALPQHHNNTSTSVETTWPRISVYTESEPALLSANDCWERLINVNLLKRPTGLPTRCVKLSLIRPSRKCAQDTWLQILGGLFDNDKIMICSMRKLSHWFTPTDPLYSFQVFRWLNQ